MLRSLMVALTVVCLATLARAGEECCPIAKAMEKLPQLVYKIGDQETCCVKTAAKLAGETGKSIHYFVAKKSYSTEPKAFAALADATDAFVKEFAKPSKCDVSGEFKVAGKSVCCEVMAGETAKLVKDAMDKVKMTYLVGDQKCDCPVEAKELAKKEGKQRVFLVAKEKLCCGTTARLALARAKYKAAVEALAKLDEKKPSDS